MDLFPKNSRLPKKTKGCYICVTLKLSLYKNLLSDNHRRKLCLSGVTYCRKSRLGQKLVLFGSERPLLQDPDQLASCPHSFPDLY